MGPLELLGHETTWVNGTVHQVVDVRLQKRVGKGGDVSITTPWCLEVRWKPQLWPIRPAVNMQNGNGCTKRLGSIAPTFARLD